MNRNVYTIGARAIMDNIQPGTRLQETTGNNETILNVTSNKLSCGRTIAKTMYRRGDVKLIKATRLLWIYNSYI